jgi:hypothetical protein
MTGKKPATIEQTASHASGEPKSARVVLTATTADPIPSAQTCAIQGASSEATTTAATIFAIQ